MHCPQLNITVNGTSKCTMSCRYCNAHKTLNRPDITFIQLCDGIKMIEDEFESIGSKRLHFNSQDSSLIYKTVVDPAIKKFNGDYKISFHSNGILLNDNNLQQFVENNIRLMISLDGPKHVQDINRLNRQGNSTFDLIWTKINKAINLGITVNVVSTFDFNSIDYIYDSYIFHMNTPPQYRFQFLFDVQNSNYIDKYILINELFKKIGNDFSQRSRQERLKFTSINYFLQKQEPVIAVTICSKDIKVKRHKHLFDILYENSEHNNSFALKAPFTLTEEDLIYFINCPGNKKQCINCPGYWLLNYENENKNFNLNIYCRLYTAIFNSLRERGQL